MGDAPYLFTQQVAKRRRTTALTPALLPVALATLPLTSYHEGHRESVDLAGAELINLPWYECVPLAHPGASCGRAFAKVTLLASGSYFAKAQTFGSRKPGERHPRDNSAAGPGCWLMYRLVDPGLLAKTAAARLPALEVDDHSRMGYGTGEAQVGDSLNQDR